MTKTNTRSRIVGILLVLVMLLTMVPITGVTANAAEWTTVNSYEQFEAAMTAEGQRSIKLGSDIDTGTLNSGMGLLDTLAVKGQKQLDLNGHTLRLFTQKSALGDLIKVENSSLTLSDSSAAQTGRILGVTSGDADVLINVWENGKFTMNSGKLEVEVYTGSLRGVLWNSGEGRSIAIMAERLSSTEVRSMFRRRHTKTATHTRPNSLTSLMICTTAPVATR